MKISPPARVIKRARLGARDRLASVVRGRRSYKIESVVSYSSPPFWMTLSNLRLGRAPPRALAHARDRKSVV